MPFISLGRVHFVVFGGTIAKRIQVFLRSDTEAGPADLIRVECWPLAEYRLGNVQMNEEDNPLLSETLYGCDILWLSVGIYQ